MDLAEIAQITHPKTVDQALRYDLDLRIHSPVDDTIELNIDLLSRIATSAAKDQGTIFRRKMLAAHGVPGSREPRAS